LVQAPVFSTESQRSRPAKADDDSRISHEEHIEHQQCQIFPPAKRHVYMSFVRNRIGRDCRFHQNDLRKTPISRGFVFRSAEKIYEVAQRGDGFIDMESRDALDEAVALGRGGSDCA
jgi:hypothetical protein